MEHRAYFQGCLLTAILMMSLITYGKSSHLLNPRRTSGRYLNIQDRVIESCRGHFMCEVFPYYDSFGLNCLNVSRVCDGTRHCQDGSDELPAMCSGFSRNSEVLNRTLPGSIQELRGPNHRVLRIIRTGTSNSSVLQTYGPNVDLNAYSNGLPNTNKTSVQIQSLDMNNMDKIVNTSPSQGIDGTTYPSVQNIHRPTMVDDSVTPSTRRRSQSQRGTMFDHLSRFMHVGNPFASFGMPDQNQEQPGSFATDYYTMQSRRRNLGRNFNMNALQSNGMLRRTFNEMNSRRLANRAESEYSRSASSGQFANRRLSLPGSSYLDTPVSTPSPNIPDGFVYKPGNEPHLAAEQQFLEQQFYLTNELSGPVRQQQQTAQTDRKEKVTEQERIRNQMQMSRARQERLLRQQFFGLEGPIANNDLNSERYGVSGPFDGGVPSLPGEVKGLHNMHGSEAQSAIHNVEALH